MLRKNVKARTSALPSGRSTKVQLNLMLLYIAVVYVPFLVFIITGKYDVVTTSISSIAWKLGGRPYIILYGTLTIPFLLYEAYFYMRFNRKDRDALALPLLIGCLILGIGIVFPDRGGDFSTQMHCRLSQLGSIILAVSITGVVRRYLKKRKGEGKRVNAKLALLYGAFLLVTAAILLLDGTTALWEAGSTVCFLVFLYIINRLSVKELGSNQDGPAEPPSA